MGSDGIRRRSPFSPPLRAAAVLLLLPVVAVASGCGSVRVAEPLTGRLGGSDTRQRTEFWDALTRRPVVSNDEAFHALLLYFLGTDPGADYAGRVRALKARGMLPAGFDRPGDQAIDRGTLAVALVKATGIKGGLTMRLTGVTPRYAVRALEHRNLLPPSSPNQVLSGGELVSVMGRVEDYQRGNPAGLPSLRVASTNQSLAGVATGLAPGPSPAVPVPPEGTSPGAAPPSTRPFMLGLLDGAEGAGGLTATITQVDGPSATVVRAGRQHPEPAEEFMEIQQSDELETGDNSRIVFIIRDNVRGIQEFAVERLTKVTLLRANLEANKVTTRLRMYRGRISLATRRGGGTGPDYDIYIRGPNSASGARGTVISLADEPGFPPEAVSLVGEAVFRNTRGQLVPFGGVHTAVIRGAQASAAEAALERAVLPPDSEVVRNDFDNRLITLILRRGGIVRGDVVAGNLAVTEGQLRRLLPGALNFVLRWEGGPSRELNDLNLAVFSPRDGPTVRDFVANPPFLLSLDPANPAARRSRRNSGLLPPRDSGSPGQPRTQGFYPRTSATGGRIGKNSVGPEGLEIASWPANHPVGLYRVVVFNLLDAADRPSETVRPVPFTVDVYQDGRQVTDTLEGTVGELQTALLPDVPIFGSSGGRSRKKTAGKPKAQQACPLQAGSQQASTRQAAAMQMNPKRDKHPGAVPWAVRARGPGGKR